MRRLIFALIGYAVARYLNSDKQAAPEKDGAPRRKATAAKAPARKTA